MELTRTTYTMALWRDGKRVGVPMDFDSLPQAKEYAFGVRTPNGAPAFQSLMEVDYKAKPDPNWDGFVIQEIRTVHRAGDPVGGVRLYA